MQISVCARSILFFRNNESILLGVFSTCCCSFFLPSSNTTISKLSLAMSMPTIILNSIILFLIIKHLISVNVIELTQNLNNGSYPNFYLSMVQSTDRGPASHDRFFNLVVYLGRPCQC